MVVAIDIASLAKQPANLCARQTRQSFSDGSDNLATGLSIKLGATDCAPHTAVRQASAASANAEVDFLNMHAAFTNRTAVEIGSERDSDSDLEPQSPCSSCGEDNAHEHHGHLGWHTSIPGHDTDATSQLYDAANVLYSRQQESQRRPAIRWQAGMQHHGSAQARHGPQHAILTAKKSCLKQRPEGYSLWFCEAQPGFPSINENHNSFASLKSIDGGTRETISAGRKRSRLSSYN